MSRLIGTTTGFGALSSETVKVKIPSLKVFFAGTIWRTLGTREAAETLLKAVSGDDEQNRMLAGMSFVKAGSRSLRFIEEKIASGEATAPLLQLLPDVDGDKARTLLNEIASEQSGELANTAQQCLELMDRIDALPPEDK